MTTNSDTTTTYWEIRPMISPMSDLESQIKHMKFEVIKLTDSK